MMSETQQSPGEWQPGQEAEQGAQQADSAVPPSRSTAEDAWRSWHAQRTAEAAAPFGPLSVTGTHWIATADEGRLPQLPGEWTVTADGEGVLLRAAIADGMAVDGELLLGTVLLGADTGPPQESRVSYGDRRLVLLRREGQWAVRVFDSGAAARRAFAGIDVFPYHPDWVCPGTFRSYGPGHRSVRVGNADGVERGLELAGELTVAGPDGAEHALQVAQYPDGALWAVLADRTSGHTSYRFRFLYTSPPEPDRDRAADAVAGAGTVPGAVTVDLNRMQLPPCAFTEHFLCPLPPPGNTLPFAVTAGERHLTGHRPQ